MEAKQFFSCSISPLVTKSFSCKWSKDNQLAIVTEKGVHVIDIIPAPTQANPILNICRTFFCASENLPGECYLEEVLSEIFDWPKEQIYSFLMHDSYTPNFPKANKLIPEVIDVFWSPQKLSLSRQCIIAIVTSSGSVELAMNINKAWITIHEFTPAWVEIINSDLKAASDKAKLDYSSLKEKFERLVATTAVWSCLYQDSNDKNFAYLITAHRNSEIVVWKVCEIIVQNDRTADVSVNIELKFKKKLIDTSIKINTLLWVDINNNNYMLIVGYFNGQVGILKLTVFEGGLTSDSYSTCYSDADNIAVDYLEVLQQTDNSIEILIIKGMHVIILLSDISGNMISMRYTSSPGFSITGASVIDSNTILVASQDGILSVITKSEEPEDLICEPVKLETTKNVQYLGLANSENKFIFTLITSPSMMYDHLSNREPSSVCFFSLRDIKRKPLDVLYKSDQSLNKCWDCLELIKVDALKYNNLPQVLLKILLNLETLSLPNLRVAYWILIINETWKKKNSSETIVKPSEEVEMCRTYIFLHSAANHLTHLLRQKNLTELQRQCINLLRIHLEIWLAGEEEEETESPLYQLVKQILEATSNFELQPEKCNLCKVDTDPWASKCPSGHILPRCAITCLQITETEYRSCIVCKELFHPCLDLELKEVRCLYCDLPALYRNQILDWSVLSSKRNLSRKKTVNNNKELKEEEPKEEEIIQNVD